MDSKYMISICIQSIVAVIMVVTIPVGAVRTFDYLPLGIDNPQEQQITQWQQDMNVKLSNGFVSELFENYKNSHWIAVGSFATSRGIEISYETIGNAFDTFAGLENTPKVAPILSSASILMEGFAVGMDTVWRTGKSMQIINPPIYLDTWTSSGWTGEGPLPRGGHYWQNLITEEPNIKSITTIEYITPFSYRYENIEMNTPSSGMERFLMHIFPLGSYFDPEQTTISKTFVSNDYFKTINGIVQPMKPMTPPTMPMIPSMPMTPPTMPMIPSMPMTPPTMPMIPSMNDW